MSGWDYHVDENGKRIRPAPRHLIGETIMRVKPTKPHALSHPDDGGREERLVFEARRMRAEERLTEPERQVLRLQRDVLREVTYECESAEELARYLDADWLQVSGLTVTKDVMDPGMTYAEIAVTLGLSVYQVHRLVKSARRKLRGAR